MRSFFLAGILFWLCVAAAKAEDLPPLLFERDVRPIFKAQCFLCHGEEKVLEGELDLRLRRLALTGGESGPAILPGNRKQSLLYQRVASGEMPDGEKKLSAEQVELIGRWIDLGAPTARPEPEVLGPEPLFTEEERKHWAFQPITRPKIPTVKAADRARTPIDSFVLARLESRGLTFSPDADKTTLIRRATFDLTGLPPTPEEIDAFVNDESRLALERLLDRLTSSPRYGERWGRHWLDAAGHADSDGYVEADPERKYAYKYRDYVIQAFNEDKPFDAFIQEQLAG
ncbi:MAG: DUF1549 domain-containing protein, partial [Planctomycetales bacterium]